MRHRTGAVATALLLAACAPQGTEAERRRDAARADSSAAGYDVGPLQPVSSPPPASTAPTVVASASSGAAGPPGPRAATAAVRDTARARTPAVAPRSDSAPVAKAALPRPPVTPAPPPATPEPAPVPTGPVQDGELLWYDASQRLVRFRLVAGYSGINDGLNFNGATSGSRTLVVPLGWQVHVTVVNDDDALSHSALVARHELPVPPEPPAPVFAGAGIPSLARGLPPGESEEMTFTATTTGPFMFVCGVPGHGEGGMWITLEVSATAGVPAYR